MYVFDLAFISNPHIVQTCVVEAEYIAIYVCVREMTVTPAAYVKSTLGAQHYVHHTTRSDYHYYNYNDYYYME